MACVSLSKLLSEKFPISTPLAPHKAGEGPHSTSLLGTDLCVSFLNIINLINEKQQLPGLKWS